MEKFLLLFRNTPQEEAAFQALSPEDMQAEIKRWTDWIGGIAAQGKLISTEGLHTTGRVLSNAGSIITDGPYAESKELVGGFMLCHADSYDEATEFAKGCPSLVDGGTVEVRHIQDFGE
jgi:hypothetical protein